MTLSNLIRDEGLCSTTNIDLLCEVGDEVINDYVEMFLNLVNESSMEEPLTMSPVRLVQSLVRYLVENDREIVEEPGIGWVLVE